MDALLFGYLAGGFVVCLLVAIFFFLPFGRPYFGRRMMIAAGLIPVLAYPFASLLGGIIGAVFRDSSGDSILVLLYLAIAASGVLVLPPLLESKPDQRLRRPVIAALAVFAADAWNCYIFQVASDPCFMGGCC
jgi:hypothetical protein